MKKILSILLSILLIFVIAGCGEKNETEKGPIQENIPMDSYEENTLINYLKTSEEPLILYNAKEISKDAEITDFYVIKEGKCRKYNYYFTNAKKLGDLSNMTDEQILKMLDDDYVEQLVKAESKWREKIEAEVFEKGYTKTYKPVSYDINACLITDDTGNSVAGEILTLPLAGIDDRTCVITYSEYGEPNPDSLLCYDNAWNVTYFKRNSSNRDFLNETTDSFYFTDSSITTGTVYKSNYYGFLSESSEWTDGKGILFFRNQDAFVLNLGIDDMSSKDILHIDPKDIDIENLAFKYRNEYYKNFK